MRIKSVKIKNFRTLEDVALTISDCDKCLVLFGKNNTGKSNVFRSLDVFFSNSTEKAPIEIFKNPQIDIEIVVRFSQLTDDEKTIHQNNLINDEIVIKQVVKPPQGGRERRITYSAARVSTNDDIIKSDYSPIFEDITDNLSWVENPSGPRNVFEGYLPKYFYLPAIDDVDEHLSLKKNQRVGELIADIIDRIASGDPSIDEIKRGLAALNSVSSVNDFNNRISNYLSELFPNTNFKLSIGEPDFLKVIELSHSFSATDQAETHPTAKGEGMQRAIIFAILREYSELIRNRLIAGSAVRSLIFAIEEPELFMHPQMQESFKNILSQICTSDQVFFSTHSPYLIDIENRRNYIRVVKDDTGVTSIVQLEDIYAKYSAVFNGNPSEEDFNLGLLINPFVSMMFFADNVVLVEGDDDESFLLPLIKKQKNTLRSSRVTSIINVNGKGNLSTFCVFLNEYEIPYLAIYDEDGSPTGGQIIEDIKDKKTIGQTHCSAPCLDDLIKNNLPSALGNLSSNFVQTRRTYGAFWKFSDKFSAYRIGNTLNYSDLPTALKTKLDNLI